MKMFLAMAVTLLATASFAHASCQEGDVQNWPTQADNASTFGGESVPSTTWVCKSGRYQEVGVKHSAVTRRSCNEGSIEMFPDDSVDMSKFGGESASAPNVPYICKNGRFVNQYHPSAKHSARAVRCTEGRIEQFATGGGDGGPSYIETYVCRNGSLKHVRTEKY
jgi:hypothetical protein